MDTFVTQLVTMDASLLFQVKKNSWLIGLLLICFGGQSQQRFTLRLEPSTVTSAPSVHSGAFGAFERKWFYIGGRKNGLHGFLTPSAFLPDGINDSIHILDPVANQRWSFSTETLPDSIREPITSSNMEFYLEDSTLYMVGGYGWKEELQDFITWPTLTAINLRGLIDAVISQQPIESFFRQITDSNLAVCGAHLQKMDSTYYLVFGHRFDGFYSRVLPSAINRQDYTYEVRKFQIADDGNQLSIYNYMAVRDSQNFRRRDYNLIPFIDPFRGEGLLAFSGVFQPDRDLPYLTPVEIYPDTVIVRNDFNQNLSQYHSAVCALYDSFNYVQHNIFFGGMSMYYMDTVTQQTITDTLVPFVRTISDVVRDMDFNYHEFDAGIRMPGLMGTNAYFFPDLDVPMFRNHFIDLNRLPSHQRLGYLTQGITSLDLNIADNNPAAMSYAGSAVYEVYLDTIQQPSGWKEINAEVLHFYCYPNPARDRATVEFEIKQAAQVQIDLMDVKGAVVMTGINTWFEAGIQVVELSLSKLSAGVYNCVLTTNGHRKSVRLTKR